jgi:predicted RNA-binding Zn ribbon-like protein
MDAETPERSDSAVDRPSAADGGRRPPGIGQAPGRLELVRAFVNTLDIEERTEELDSPAALASWLASRGLGEDPAARELARGSAGSPWASGDSAGDLRMAIAVRESLRGVLLAHTDRDARPAAGTAELASIAAALPVRLDVDPGGAVRPTPAGRGVATGLAGLLLIAAEAATAGTWARLKVCGADDCRWAFYDRSPARSGSWCSMAICGSRAKSRAYRRRSSRQVARAASGAAPTSTAEAPGAEVVRAGGWSSGDGLR